MKKRKILLDGKTWLKRSISVWSDHDWRKEERTLGYPALFPIDIAKRILEVYCPPQGWVIDPFAGSGTTLVASRELKLIAEGIDINPKYTHMMYERLVPLYEGCEGAGEIIRGRKGNYVDDFTLFDNESSSMVHRYDARLIEIIHYHDIGMFDVCLTSPPYWDIHTMKRTADLKEERRYSYMDDDLGNFHDYKVFMKELEKCFAPMRRLIKPDGHCIIIAMDIRKKNIFFPFHIDIIYMMAYLGWILQDIVIWDRRKDYNNLRPLGYPYVMRFNKVHEYIMIFKNGL